MMLQNIHPNVIVHVDTWHLRGCQKKLKPHMNRSSLQTDITREMRVD